MKKSIIFLVVGLCLFFTSNTIRASGPNYATSTEYIQLFYRGDIQMQSSYYDWEFGGHVYNGYMRYTNNHDIDSGRIYVGPGKSRYDGTIYSRTHIQRDSLDSFAPKTQFFYNFNVAPTSAWPMYGYSFDDNTDHIWGIEYTFPVSGTIEHE